MTKRIMIVDDEAVIAFDIETMLREAGYEIVGVSGHPADAIAQFERGGADLAVLDADLAGQSAAPVADRLRDARVPFVVVSGYTRQQIDWLGAEPSILKPFAQQQLLDTVRRAVDAGSAAA